MIGIPEHLCATHAIRLRRTSGSGGLGGWKSPQGDSPDYWSGTGYVSLPLSRSLSRDDSGVQQGHAFFYFEASEGGELPKASDQCDVDDVTLEVVAVRPPNSLIAYWKLDLKTGAA